MYWRCLLPPLHAPSKGKENSSLSWVGRNAIRSLCSVRRLAEHVPLPRCCCGFSFKDRRHLKVLNVGLGTRGHLGVTTVVCGAALSSVPVVEDKLSPDLALCIFLVDLYVASAFFWVFISSLLYGLKKVDCIIKILWFLVASILDPLICFRSCLFFRSPWKQHTLY